MKLSDYQAIVLRSALNVPIVDECFGIPFGVYRSLYANLKYLERLDGRTYRLTEEGREAILRYDASREARLELPRRENAA